MDVAGVYIEAYGRITGIVERTLDGLDEAALTWQPDPSANSIGWLVWHLTRVQDDHVSELAKRPQAWETDAWAPRFGLADDTKETGYGHSAEQVRALRPTNVATALDYHRTVAARTAAFLETLVPADLDEIIDESYDPPVSMGVRLVSALSDNLQHAGQAAYVRGIYERTAGSSAG